MVSPGPACLVRRGNIRRMAPGSTTTVPSIWNLACSAGLSKWWGTCPGRSNSGREGYAPVGIPVNTVRGLQPGQSWPLGCRRAAPPPRPRVREATGNARPLPRRASGVRDAQGRAGRSPARVRRTEAKRSPQQPDPSRRREAGRRRRADERRPRGAPPVNPKPHEDVASGNDQQAEFAADYGRSTWRKARTSIETPWSSTSGDFWSGPSGGSRAPAGTR